METQPEQQIVTVGRYALAGPYSEYVKAAEALIRRAELDGVPGVLSYQFYGDEEAAAAANIMVYRDSVAWLRHHDTMKQWEERIPFGHSVRFVEYRVHGRLSDDVLSSLAKTGIPYGYFPDRVAGFVR